MNKEYDMQKYAPLFVDKDKATIVYNEILQLDPSNNDIEINNLDEDLFKIIEE